MTTPTVSLDFDTINRISQVMPPPTRCLAFEAVGSLSPTLQDAVTRLGHLERVLTELLARPLRCEATERVARALTAASAGWQAEAATDLVAALELDPYQPTAHLALAYLQLDDAADESWYGSLLRALRYGARFDPPVAVRAALMLSDKLKELGRGEDARRELEAASAQIDSSLLHRAVFGDPPPPVYGAELEAVLAAAADADVEVDPDQAPRLGDPADSDRIASFLEHVRGRASERWPTPAAEVRSTLEQVTAQRDDIAAKLSAHREKPAVVAHIYEARLAELERQIEAAQADADDAERAMVASRVVVRERLEAAMAGLRATTTRPADSGVAPIGEGLPALIAARG